MSMQEKKGGNIFAIITMFALFFMIAFVTNFAGSMGIIVKEQFGASNAASQLGSAANFIAYLFMGIPGGLILKRKGYKFTALLATAVGFAGVGVQLASGYCESFVVYVTGAFIAGFSMCLLNLVVNPLLNTLGGEGKKGNQLVQIGCSLNSVGATLAPVILGYLIGGEVAKAKVVDAAPALMIAMGLFALAFLVVAFSAIPEPHKETAEEKAARLNGGASVFSDIISTLKFRHFTLGALAIFFYIIIECGIPNMANLYMTQEGSNGFVGAAIAGSVVGAYWFCMMIGRLVGGAIGGKVSSRVMITICSLLGISLMLASIYCPVKMVSVFGKEFPLSMCFMVACGLCTSVMWGGIFNMAAEGLGKYIPMGSGIFMAMVCGGMMLPVQGLVADTIGILNSYWVTIGLLAYVLFYALIGSRVTKRADS
ncbi:MAG: MFS transporter [Kiritimatiellae bacterium]|nr:MFS transporter [Kiritimatiellia bacterium]MBR3777398.1 MFS transporter [Kiritimatiellia bacterium]